MQVACGIRCPPGLEQRQFNKQRVSEEETVTKKETEEYAKTEAEPEQRQFDEQPASEEENELDMAYDAVAALGAERRWTPFRAIWEEAGRGRITEADLRLALQDWAALGVMRGDRRDRWRLTGDGVT